MESCHIMYPRLCPNSSEHLSWISQASTTISMYKQVQANTGNTSTYKHVQAITSRYKQLLKLTTVTKSGHRSIFETLTKFGDVMIWLFNDNPLNLVKWVPQIRLIRDRKLIRKLTCDRYNNIKSINQYMILFNENFPKVKS